jgi:hypothetical protein
MIDRHRFAVSILAAAGALLASACDPRPSPGDGLAPAPLAADTGGPPAPAPAPPVTDPPRTLRGFTQECGVALGPVPGFDCMEDAVEVPITIGGVPVGPADARDDLRCDKPVMLTGNCIAYSRVGHKTGRTWDGREDPDVDWVFTCRRNTVSPGPTGGVFGDIAMIGHRKSTGETCFFQAFPTEPWTRAPAPLEPPEATPPGAPTAEAFWLPPGSTAGIACHRCHDNDPWIHSPWIDQARHPLDPSRTLVPPGGGRDAPYVVVGRAFRAWEKDLRHLNPAGNGCVACHRIGTGGTCGAFARYSTGDAGFYPVSDSAAAFPASHWMPPGAAGTEAAWDAVWGDDIAEIIACCGNPGDPACGTEAIPTARP